MFNKNHALLKYQQQICKLISTTILLYEHLRNFKVRISDMSKGNNLRKIG